VARPRVCTPMSGAAQPARDDSSVRVCLRVRPLMPHEKAQNCSSVISYPNPDTVLIGTDRLFTYDYVKGEQATQAEVYEDCVSSQVQAFMQGYNATIFAYGQTGSGKTFTMGTSSNASVPLTQLGIIPRVVREVFSMIEQRKATTKYSARVSFLEIHNEEIKDLLAASTSPDGSSPSGSNDLPGPVIREGPDGQIIVMGAVEEEVNSAEEMMNCLERGTLARTTAPTLMNQHSSRSHAIFTFQLMQQRTAATSPDGSPGDQDDEILRSKFHFVDLAGSERLKRTGAVGERMKEGISINCGLLALGNVISALSDPNRRGQHVPFRDSKITRLLQDSLGGNSKTLMIACVSPADINFEESLNTLKYAQRARNIKNKAVINRDPNAAKLTALRERISELESLLAVAGIKPEDVSALSAAALSGSVSSTQSTNAEKIISLLRNVGLTISQSGLGLSSNSSSAGSPTTNTASPGTSFFPLQQLGMYPSVPNELMAARQAARNYEAEVQRLNGRVNELSQQLAQAQERAIHAETARDALRLKMERMIHTIEQFTQGSKTATKSDDKSTESGDAATSDSAEAEPNNHSLTQEALVATLNELAEDFRSDTKLSPGEIGVLDENRRTIQLLQTKLDRKKRALSEALKLVKTLTKNLHGSSSIRVISSSFGFDSTSRPLSAQAKDVSKASLKKLNERLRKGTPTPADESNGKKSENGSCGAADGDAVAVAVGDQVNRMDSDAEYDDAGTDADTESDLVEDEADDQLDDKANTRDEAGNAHKGDEDEEAAATLQAEEEARAELDEEAQNSEEEELLADMAAAPRSASRFRRGTADYHQVNYDDLHFKVDDDSDIDDDIKAFTLLSQMQELEFQREMNRMSSAHRDLDAQIASKQDLIVQLTRTRERADEEKRDYEQKIKFMEQEIMATQQESKRAIQEQKDTEQANIQAKLYQEKIRQLEARLRDLQDKTKELERLRSLYASDELKIKRLEEEIAITKRERARLDRQMREKREEYRMWVREQEKKIEALARESRRNKLEAQDLRNQLNKERAVLRRHAQENAALRRELVYRAERQKRAESIRNNRPGSVAVAYHAAATSAAAVASTDANQKPEDAAVQQLPKPTRAQIRKSQLEAREAGWVGIGQPERRTASVRAAEAHAASLLGFGSVGAQAAAQAIQGTAITRRGSQPNLGVTPTSIAPMPYVGDHALSAAKSELVRCVEHAVSRYELQTEMRKFMRQLLVLEQKEKAADDQYTEASDLQETAALEALLDNLRTNIRSLQASIEIAVSEYDHLLPAAAPCKGDRRGIVKLLRDAVESHLERRQKQAERERSRNQLRAVLHGLPREDPSEIAEQDIDVYDDLVDSRGQPIVTGVDVDLLHLQSRTGMPPEAISPAAKSLIQHVMEHLARARALNQKYQAHLRQLQEEQQHLKQQQSQSSGNAGDSKKSGTGRTQRSREALLERQVRELADAQLKLVRSLRMEFMERIKPLKLTQQQLDIIFMPLDSRREKIIQNAAGLGIVLEVNDTVKSAHTSGASDASGRQATDTHDDVLAELPKVSQDHSSGSDQAVSPTALNAPSTPPGAGRPHMRMRSESNASAHHSQGASPGASSFNLPPPPPSPRPRSVGPERNGQSRPRTAHNDQQAGKPDASGKLPDVFVRLTDVELYTGTSRQTAHERKGESVKPPAGTTPHNQHPPTHHSGGVESVENNESEQLQPADEEPESDPEGYGASNARTPSGIRSATSNNASGGSLGRPQTAGSLVGGRKKPLHKNLQVNINTANDDSAPATATTTGTATTATSTATATTTTAASTSSTDIFSRLADKSNWTGVHRTRAGELEVNTSHSDGSQSTAPLSSGSRPTNRLSERMTSDMMNELRQLQQLQKQIKRKDRNPRAPATASGTTTSGAASATPGATLSKAVDAESATVQSPPSAEAQTSETSQDPAGSMGFERRPSANSVFESAFSASLQGGSSGGADPSKLQHLRMRAATRRAPASADRTQTEENTSPASGPRPEHTSSPPRTTSPQQLTPMRPVVTTAVPPPPEGTPPSASENPPPSNTSMPPLSLNVKPVPLGQAELPAMRVLDGSSQQTGLQPSPSDFKRHVTVLPPPPPTPIDGELPGQSFSSSSSTGSSNAKGFNLLSHISAEALTAALEAVSDDDEE